MKSEKIESRNSRTPRAGGSAWESNPPNPTSSGHTGFEDQGSHQAPSTPVLRKHKAGGTGGQNLADLHGLGDERKIPAHGIRRDRDEQSPRRLRIDQQHARRLVRRSPIDQRREVREIAIRPP